MRIVFRLNRKHTIGWRKNLDFRRVFLYAIERGRFQNPVRELFYDRAGDWFCASNAGIQAGV